MTHLPTNRHYIGSRSDHHNRRPLEDIGKQYFTSSRSVYTLFRQHPKDFRIKIIRVYHLNYQQAVAFEQRLIARVHAVESPRFFNEAVQVDGGYRTMRGFIPAVPGMRQKLGTIRILAGGGYRIRNRTTHRGTGYKNRSW